MSSVKRYPTDLTDRQWSIVESLLPSEPPRGPGGRPASHEKREVVNAILYLSRAGCAWRMLPKDFCGQVEVAKPEQNVHIAEH
jgi:transposase